MARAKKSTPRKTGHRKTNPKKTATASVTATAAVVARMAKARGFTAVKSFKTPSARGALRVTFKGWCRNGKQYVVTATVNDGLVSLRWHDKVADGTTPTKAFSNAQDKGLRWYNPRRRKTPVPPPAAVRKAVRKAIPSRKKKSNNGGMTKSDLLNNLAWPSKYALERAESYPNFRLGRIERKEGSNTSAINGSFFAWVPHPDGTPHKIKVAVEISGGPSGFHLYLSGRDSGYSLLFALHDVMTRASADKAFEAARLFRTKAEAKKAKPRLKGKVSWSPAVVAAAKKKSTKRSPAQRAATKKMIAANKKSRKVATNKAKQAPKVSKATAARVAATQTKQAGLVKRAAAEAKKERKRIADEVKKLKSVVTRLERKVATEKKAQAKKVSPTKLRKGSKSVVTFKRPTPAEQEKAWARIVKIFKAERKSMAKGFPELIAVGLDADTTLHDTERHYAMTGKVAGKVWVKAAPELGELTDSRIRGVIRHELGHAAVILGYQPLAKKTKTLPCYDAIERQADRVAEKLSGSKIFYDAKGIEVSGPGARGQRPRPKGLR